jgi:hypothetical protein
MAYQHVSLFLVNPNKQLDSVLPCLLSCFSKAVQVCVALHFGQSRNLAAAILFLAGTNNCLVTRYI